MIEVPIYHRLTLTLPQAAAVSGIPLKVITGAVLDGRLPVCYAGSSRQRIRRSDLDEYVRRLPDTPDR